MPNTVELPLQEVPQWQLQEKYAQPGEETRDDIRRRVAKALVENEGDNADFWEGRFLKVQQEGLIMAGRTNSAAGVEGINRTWINCFVQPVMDSATGFVDGLPGIYPALSEAAETLRLGGGVGYTFNHLRPAGAWVKGTNSKASGPVSYMHVFSQSCKTVEGAGARRGAQMATLRIDHPDIEEYIDSKKGGALDMFNISVLVTDAFIDAVSKDEMFALWHQAEPHPSLLQENGGPAYSSKVTGMWVYKTVKARDLWDKVMENTYDHGEPGVIFIDRINKENNLGYCETIESTNPCAEQPLPNYGCCDLASVNLSKLIVDPFTDSAHLDQELLVHLVEDGVRMLDNVLDLTPWPLEKQREEAMAKRRVGLGVMGVGNMLTMLGVKYSSQEGRNIVAKTMELVRNVAYRTSINLAKERGPFPLFDPDKYLESPFIQRLPRDIRDELRTYGIRNSHLLSVAPTGTIALTFGNNTSNGIEPSFAWEYTRRIRGDEGLDDWKEVRVKDYAQMVWETMTQPRDITITSGFPKTMNAMTVPPPRPDSFESALEISANDHAAMVAAVQPFVDSSISKTVNIPTDYPFEGFKLLYANAYAAGAKSLATFRPNAATGEGVLIADKEEDLVPDPLDIRITVDKWSDHTVDSIRWPKRPEFPSGNHAWMHYIRNGGHSYGVVVSDGNFDDGHAIGEMPFEVWVTGRPPRGLSAMTKTLSHDMYSRDAAWLNRKLKVLMKTKGVPFTTRMPPTGQPVTVGGHVAAFSSAVWERANELMYFDLIGEEPSPVLDSVLSLKEPKSGPKGASSWYADIKNPTTGDDFVMFVKEIEVEGFGRMPLSMWFSGEYPEVFDGLCKSLSMDMQVIDLAWIGRKLYKLLDFEEYGEDFFAPNAVTGKGQRWPSTVAYVVHLLLARYTKLGLLNDWGLPTTSLGILRPPSIEGADDSPEEEQRSSGSWCRECGKYAVVKEGGCSKCTWCGAIGDCG